MKVLIIGSGAREHALSWCLRQNSSSVEIFCAPGNAGTSSLAKNRVILEENITEMVRLAQQEKIDLTLVGPEAPLCAGITDAFERANLKIVGPLQKAAQLEGNKAFTKNLLQRYQLPTASARIFQEATQARAFINQATFPRVIKASGLAGGKGVFVVKDQETALTVIEKIMEEKIFGDAGNTILIEEFLSGEEVSLQVLVCGEQYHILPLVRDYKRLHDDDLGPNTGGMGACGPIDSIALEKLENNIVKPLLKALTQEGLFYQGVLYLGLILTSQGPKILEINCRFGDPEFSVLALVLKGNWLETFEALAKGVLLPNSLQAQGFSTTIVKASLGYPLAEKGAEKNLISFSLGEERDQVQIFQGKTFQKGQQFFSEGGRVLQIAAWAKTQREARAKAYEAAKQKHFNSEIYRQDIARSL